MTDLKDLFETVLAEPAHDRLDVNAAIRRGRRRRAAKTFGALGAAAVAVGVVAAVALSVFPRQTTPVAGPSPSASAPTGSAAAPDGSRPAESSADLEGSWYPRELDGRDFADIVRPATRGGSDPVMVLNVEFVHADDGGWSVRSQDYCNFFSETYAVDAGRFRTTDLVRTQKACPQVAPALAEAGALNLRALTDADEAQFVPDPVTGAMDLVLLQDGTELARYSRPRGQAEARTFLQSAPELTVGSQQTTRTITDVVQLVGTWRVQEIGGHDVTGRSARIRDVEFTVEVADLPEGPGAWSAHDGCNTWNGSYEITDGRFRVPSAGGSTYAFCADVDVPATAAILALTTADEARFLDDSRANQLTTLLLLKEGRVLATYVQVP